MIIYYSGGRKANGNGEPENVLSGGGNVMLAFGYHIIPQLDGLKFDSRAEVVLGLEERECSFGTDATASLDTS